MMYQIDSLTEELKLYVPKIDSILMIELDSDNKNLVKLHDFNQYVSEYVEQDTAVSLIKNFHETLNGNIIKKKYGYDIILKCPCVKYFYKSNKNTLVPNFTDELCNYNISLLSIYRQLIKSNKKLPTG